MHEMIDLEAGERERERERVTHTPLASIRAEDILSRDRALSTMHLHAGT
jgi:hypothetical protein